MSSIDDSAVVLLRKRFGTEKNVKQVVSDQVGKESMQKQQASKFRKHRTVKSKKTVTKPKSQLTSNATSESSKEKISVMPSEIVIEAMGVVDAAQKFGIPVNDLILTLLGWRVIAAKNQSISSKVVERLAEHYGVKAIKPRVVVQEEALTSLAVEGGDQLEERLPVVVVLGHVDHGKTTLLDFIRKTRVVAKEKGGITQHLGAYEVVTNHGNLVFLDTPGHEAFPKMRQRGVRVADIGVLVIAADDGIMPQTVEVIKNLKTMGIPIIVAINKVDKADATRIEVVKRQLAEHDLLPEEWGGQVICIPISALTGKGVDQLLEMIALQSQLLELRASRTGSARGFVLESRLERGRGPVATLILQHGMLQLGDYFICGKTRGRVSSIKNSFGNVVQQVGPSIPVLVAGFQELPEAGEVLRVVSKEEVRRDKQQQSQDLRTTRTSDENAINLIIKTDTNSSREALIDAIVKLEKKNDTVFSVVHDGVGDVSEGDIELAYSTGSTIIGLHVKAETNALSLAQRRKVSVQLYDIIYKLLESLEKRAQKAKPIEMVRTKIGEAIVRRVFDIKGVGVIAGSYVQDGKFSRDGYVVAWRAKQKIGEGRITSLQREKKTVKEAHAGYECGFVVEGMTDWQVDDRVECFVDIPK